MEKREKERNARMGERRALRLLAQYPSRCSAWLCASILVAEEYPALSRTMEEMAEREGKQFRALGRIMLQKGWNPPLRELIRGGRRYCPVLYSAKERELHSFLEKMLEEGEVIGKELENLLLICDWAGEDASLLRNNGARQMEILKRMLS